MAQGDLEDFLSAHYTSFRLLSNLSFPRKYSLVFPVRINFCPLEMLIGCNLYNISGMDDRVLCFAISLGRRR